MKEELNKCLNVLKKGGLILYPTDTIWGIGCDATNYDAVQKVFELKKRAESKALVCLVHDYKMLNQYIENIPEVAYDILKYAQKPTTIIYDKAKLVAENVVGYDESLAVRVAKDKFCNDLVKKFKRPLVSTSANISGKPSPKNFKEISDEILKGVDYVVNLHQNKNMAKPSAIIKLGSDGMVKVLRK
mgnify:FL=1